MFPQDLPESNAFVTPNKEMPDGCKICGDNAGCRMNFGCLSCESCKAFFRRCCSKPEQKQICPFVGKCKITKASRKACPACRLDKCVQKGMRKEQVDAWKRHRTDGGERGAKTRNGPGWRGKRREKPCLCKCSCGVEGGQLLAKRSSDKGTQTEGEERKLAQPSTVFDASEQSLMDELVQASLLLDSPLRLPHTPPFNLTFMDALRVSELAMRRMVGMCKQLNAFQSLDPRDQISLLRGSLVELLILRGAMAFDASHEVWRHPILNAAGDQSLPFCLNISVLPAKERHSEEHKHFLMTFGEEWRTNRDLMLILHAIVLFSVAPSSAASSKGRIEEHRSRYCSLLKRFLLLANVAQVDEAFDHLMEKLEELHRLNTSFQWLFSRVNSSELDDSLLKELLATK